MLLCIHAAILGTESHFFFDVKENQYFWSNITCSNAWVFGGNKECALNIGEVFKLFEKALKIL